jgi:putative membrane protein
MERNAMWFDYGGMGWGHGWGVFGFVHMALWWLLLLLAIGVLAKWLFTGSRPASAQALELLRERYARGEISKEEFVQKKEDLGS